MFIFTLIKAGELTPKNSSNNSIVDLPRGGTIIKTKIGNIQFGMPPETVKDSLILNLDVPVYYIIPTRMFDKKFCLSVAEFEFPAYFNFFIRKRRIVLICSDQNEIAIRKVFTETLSGPHDLSEVEHDFDSQYDIKKRPDLLKEVEHFARNPFNPNERLNVDTLLEFKNLIDGKVELSDGIRIERSNGFIFIFEDTTIIAKIKDRVKIKVSDENEHYNDFGIFVNPSMISSKEAYIEDYKPSEFIPPSFGVTILGCSHGFDPKGSTSGYIMWINGRGIMVDPPPFSTYNLKKLGIPSFLIEYIIITHCHADHDAGSFQKILETSKVELITTKTIFKSFMQKYSSLTFLNKDEISKLFKFRPAIIGSPLRINGAVFNFFYSLHVIPCIGFTINYLDKSIYFSGDTYYDPIGMLKLQEKGVLTEERRLSLIENKWNHDIILHEAGVPPIHTPVSVLAELSEDIKKRMYLVHVAEKDVPHGLGLNIAKTGLENTLRLDIGKNSPMMDFFRKLDILSSIHLFENSNIRNVRDLLDSSEERKYNKGDIICKEGNADNEFFVMLQGVVKIHSQCQNLIRYLNIGDYFGESGLFKDKERIATVYAETNTVTVLIIKRSDILFIYGENCELLSNILNLSESRRTVSLNAISKNAFFNNMSSAQKTQMEMILKKKHFPKGSKIWEKNYKAEYAVLIQKGQLSFYEIEDGKEIFNGDDDLGPGSFAGDINAMINNENNSTNLLAVEDSEAFLISKKDLLSFLNKNPGIYLLMKNTVYIP